MHHPNFIHPALTVCPEQQGGPQSTIKVAVADDCEFVRAALCEYLGMIPEFELVGQACDGREALSLAKTKSADVLLLDMSMPHMTGIQVLQELRLLNLRLRVIVHSSHPADQVRDVVLGLGAWAYLEKGGNPDMIVSAIRCAAVDLVEGSAVDMATISCLPDFAPSLDPTSRTAI